jgi:hypothetical protein
MLFRETVAVYCVRKTHKCIAWAKYTFVNVIVTTAVGSVLPTASNTTFRPRRFASGPVSTSQRGLTAGHSLPLS